MTVDGEWHHVRVVSSEVRKHGSFHYILLWLEPTDGPLVGRRLFFVLNRRHPDWDSWLAVLRVHTFTGITDEFIAADVLNREVDALVRVMTGDRYARYIAASRALTIWRIR